MEKDRGEMNDGPGPGPVDPGDWPRTELLAMAENAERAAEAIEAHAEQLRAIATESDAQATRLRTMAAEMRALAG